MQMQVHGPDSSIGSTPTGEHSRSLPSPLQLAALFPMDSKALARPAQIPLPRFPVPLSLTTTSEPSRRSWSTSLSPVFQQRGLRSCARRFIHPSCPSTRAIRQTSPSRRLHPAGRTPLPIPTCTTDTSSSSPPSSASCYPLSSSFCAHGRGSRSAAPSAPTIVRSPILPPVQLPAQSLTTSLVDTAFAAWVHLLAHPASLRLSRAKIRYRVSSSSKQPGAYAYVLIRSNVEPRAEPVSSRPPLRSWLI